MIDTKIIRDESGTIDLCETFSTENYKLKQIETGIIYGHSVIDIIAGFDDNDKPFSKFTYEETDEKDEPISTEEATTEDYYGG